MWCITIVLFRSKEPLKGLKVEFLLRDTKFVLQKQNFIADKK